jgi:hypothetical protein
MAYLFGISAWVIVFMVFLSSSDKYQQSVLIQARVSSFQNLSHHHPRPSFCPFNSTSSKVCYVT